LQQTAEAAARDARRRGRTVTLPRAREEPHAPLAMHWRGRPPPAMSRSPSERCFEALRAGDEEALRRLLPPLRVRLERFAKLKLRQELAEDVVQETLLTLWQRRDCVETPQHLLPFVFRILRYKIGNVYQRAPEPQSLAAQPDQGASVPASPLRAADLALEGEELDAVVRQAIDDCAREHPAWGRVLQLLREGRSPAEVGHELGDVTVSGLHVRIHRARTRLKQILRERYRIDV